AITLDVDLGLTSTGVGSVCFRSPEGRAFSDLETQVRELLDADGGPSVEANGDEFGFDWLTVRTEPADLATAVTDIHAVNTSLVQAGFGPQLLCSVFPFTDQVGNTVSLVYLYKRGTFYPFAPRVRGQDKSRNNVLELQVRDKLAGELAVEEDTTRWFALWDAPGVG
ncbi:MAG: hypothetical protein QMB00_06760, partial [Candidatus Nanopelagicales bacterium]